MRITEIEVMPPHIYFPHKFNLYLDLSKPPQESAVKFRTARGEVAFDLYSSSNDGKTCHALVDVSSGSPVTVAGLLLDFEGGHWQITKTATDANWKRNGLMRFLIDHAVATHGSITSDRSQTPDAKAMWKALIKMPGKLKLSVLDLRSGQRSPVATTDPWENNDDRVVILAEDKRAGYTPEQLREYEDYVQRRVAIGRVMDWYGPGTDEYPNP